MRPRQCNVCSSRLRHRSKRRHRLFAVASDILSALNASERSRVLNRTQSWPSIDVLRGHRLWPAWASIHRTVLERAKDLVLARRESSLTGVHAISELCHATPGGNYGSWEPRGSRHIQLRAEEIDEPSSFRTVDMLAALDPVEAAFHSAQNEVLELSGKSDVIFHEIESVYNFVEERRRSTNVTSIVRQFPTCGLGRQPRMSGLWAASRSSAKNPVGSARFSCNALSITTWLM